MKLEIKEPCHEDWSQMKIGLISRHCEVCEKGVMDFTKMNRAEIITYILSNPNDEVCGRLNRDQFDFHHEDIPILIEELKKEKVVNPFLILALVTLSLSSCSQDAPSNSQVTPNSVVENPSGVDSTELVGNNSSKADSLNEIITSGEITCDPEIAPSVGELEISEIQLMGDVIAPVSGGIGIVEEPQPEPGVSPVLQFAQKMPEFNGGVVELDNYVKSQLKYPAYEKKKGITGNVYARFIVQSDGSVTDPEIIRSVPGSKNFDKEVIRIITEMPKWIAGENNGEKVPVYMNIPIQFNLK